MEDTIRGLEVKYKTHIKRVINKNIHHIGIINQSSYDEDTTQAFDFVYEFKNSKIPVRIRQYKFFKTYRDFTIRSRSRHNMRTEYDKLKDGFGDMYFYAWENKKRTSLIAYMLIDLHVFRSSELINNTGRSIANGDGTEFYNFEMKDLIITNSLKVYENLKISY